MAKISARGATKLAQARKEWTDEDGYRHAHRYALRSDGAILKAHDLLRPDYPDERVPESKRWNRGSYSIHARSGTGRANVPAFREYFESKGYTVKVGG